MKLESISLRLDVRSRALAIGLALAVSTLAGCTKPRQTTAIGSGVGGAIGAGLGAIVGNQTGNAGSGLVVGASAGAAVGALVGNALQAQEERNTTQDEAIKRQERVIQAQKNEINELRLVRGDDSFSSNSAISSSPRYSYRGTLVNSNSAEVARQQTRLQQRGPRPANSRLATSSSSAAYYPSYYQAKQHQVTRHRSSRYESSRREPLPDTPSSYKPRANLQAVRSPSNAGLRTTPSEVLPPPAVLPSLSTNSSQTLARYDVQSDLSPTKGRANGAEINESDLPAPKGDADTATRAVAPTAALLQQPSRPQSKECKEALSERDAAAEATDNSDKLFHLRRALRLCPQSAPLHHELGRLYASMQRSRDAEDEFKQALSIAPSLSAAKRELGALLKEEVQF